jgi:hypothetical protein
MATATGVAATERPGGNTYTGQFTADLASIAAAGQELITVTITGLAVGDVICVSPRSALNAGLIVAYARVSAADTAIIAISNHSAGAIDAASTVFDYGVIRGSTRRLG